MSPATAKKSFKLSADRIRPLIKPMGGCFASDRITVDGAPVGFMQRNVRDGDDDSGWVFMAGDESQDYVDDANNAGIYEVNTIANYDPSIIPFLYALPGQVFERDPESGQFVEAEDSEADPDAEEIPPGMSVVQDIFSSDEGWVIVLPTPFRQRFEDGATVLWRPRITIFFRHEMNNGKTPDEVAGEFRMGMPQAAYAQERRDLDDGVEWSFRIQDVPAEERRAAWIAIVIGKKAYVTVAAYFDDEADLVAIRDLIATIDPGPP